MTAAPASDTEMSRMLNLGKPVTTKKFGDVNVKELTFEQTIICAKDLIRLLMSSVGNKEDGKDFFFKLLGNPETAAAIKRVVAMSIDKKEEDMNGVSATDMLKLLVALKEVVDWKELSELFFQLIPVSLSQNLRRSLNEKLSEVSKS